MWHQVSKSASPHHVSTVVDVALRAEPRCGATTVVAIDGPSGSGKTTLAQGVVRQLDQHGEVEVVHMDLIYPGWDGLGEAVGLLTTQVLAPIAQGQPAAYRLWSWVRDDWEGSRPVRPTPYLVVEGCASSVLPAGGYAAVKVFVEADPAVRMARGIARDGEAYRPHWQRWAAQESALFERDGTRQRADVVVDTTEL